MEYNGSNFIYLKTTSMGKYYDGLVKAEYICEYFPIITKIIVRKVLEGVLKNIAEKYNIENNVSAWNLFNNIKISSDFYLPEEICNYIEIILVNGYDHASHSNKKISKHPIEILEIIHHVLCWYLKKTEPQKMILIKNLSFKAPSTIEYQQKEINKIKEDILLKDNQIGNLRQRIIRLGSQWNSISELNKIIIVIKEEKSYLESIQVQLMEKIEEQKNQVSDMDKNYKLYMKKFEQLEKSCTEIQELIFNKESQLVKAEIQKQELKYLVNELDEKDELIRKMERDLEEELKIVRKVYENLVKLSTQYQDSLETIEFSYDKELQKILESKINSLTMQISFEDRIFNEDIINYTKNIGEAKRRVATFKEILNEKINRAVKYEPFYSGFLKLEDKELRIVYTIITSINNTSNLISKSKELILKSSEDKFLEAVNKNLKELKNISDDEIKLILYYKLIKLSQGYLGSIYNRKQFIQALDCVVDKAYEILMSKKDFKGRIRKLDAINAYYLEKIISDLKSKNSNLQINDELADKIYKSIIAAKQNLEDIEKGKIYYDKFKLDNMSETALRSAIKSHVFIFLSMMVDLGDIDSYKELSTVIVEVEKLIVKRPAFKIYEEDTLATNFSNEYFIIRLFLASGAAFFNQKQQEELVPLLVIAIMSVNLISDEDEVDLESYNNMVGLWKRKQQKYNDIFVEKEDKENELEVLIKEKSELEINCERLSKSYEVYSQNHDNYEKEFNKIVMNSEKRILLPSFEKYYKLLIKKEGTEEHINESKNKFETLKSILSPEVWKDQANKIINESNIRELEKLLIEEAKQKPYFKKEYEVFIDLKGKVEETSELLDKEKEKLKNKDSLIDNMKININELERHLNKIKDVYPDIEEGYY